jgi:hypothetical protein
MNNNAEDLHVGHDRTDVGAKMSAAIRPFASARRRAKVVCVLFGVGILLHIGLFLLTINEYEILTRIGQAEAGADKEFDANYSQQNVLVLFGDGQWIALAVTFLMWVHQTHRNLPALRATGLKFTPGWAVGWYFMPLANLFRPYEVMREIYNASAPADAPDGGDAWRAYRAPIVVKLWWVSLLILGFSNGIVAQAAPKARELADYQVTAVASAVVSIFSIVASLPAIWLVWTLTRRQEKRAEIITATNPPLP